MRFIDVLACTAMLAIPAMACAQDVETPAPATLFSFPAPPAGFLPLAASDEELARYGLPPRPALSGRNGAARAAWVRIMSAARTYVQPQVRRTWRRHGPAMVFSGLHANQAGPMTSLNWSGQVLSNGVTGYGPSAFTQVSGEWVVSAVQQAVGTCSGTDASSVWVGIDGWTGSDDVLQAGTEGDVACTNGTSSQDYYPWFEWYPDYEYEITNFIEFRGASISVVVTAKSATSGTAFFVNLQTGAYTSTGISPPSGTSLKGNSAEWIVERPSVGPQAVLTTLADFGMIAMAAESSYTVSGLKAGTATLPGSPGAGQTANTVTMLNSAGTALAIPAVQGPGAQVVNVAGPTQ
jgi:hypothetical protein